MNMIVATIPELPSMAVEWRHASQGEPRERVSYYKVAWKHHAAHSCPSTAPVNDVLDSICEHQCTLPGAIQAHEENMESMNF
jgi:hypothetical protein